MPEPFVRFAGVQKTYDGENLVVKDLNLDIAKGEFLTLLGPSGSGKTTTLMMLAGFETATHGEIYLDGQPINRLAPEKRNIGMVFQNYALFPNMTVAENIAFSLKVRGKPADEIRQRVERSLEAIGLKEYGQRRPSQMSGGQQQRVAVARALVFEPKLVLMDEPLSALDKQLREQMKFEIKRLHHDLGITVVYVTHDQSEALTMSDRVAVFHDGRIAQLDTPTGLYERPASSFVARFIGENNRLCGDVVSLNGNECVVDCAGTMIRALPVGVECAGSRTTLSLRPERVVLDPGHSNHDNMIEVKIEELVYLGDHLRIRATACGTDDFIIKIPNASDRHPHLREQQAIRVGWQASDCRALDFPQ